MDSYVPILLIAVLQVSVIALIAWFVIGFLIRVRPALAGSVAYPAVLLMLMLPAISLSPVSGWLSDLGRAAMPAASVGDGHPILSAAEREKQTVGSTTPMMWIDVGSMRARFRMLGSAPTPSRSITTPILWAILVMGVIAGLRFGAGVFFARRLIRDSRLVRHPNAIRTMKSIQNKLCPQRKLRLVESDRIASAAVSGWPVSTVMLPAEWRRWDDDQLNSVLAHELSHVARNDFPWRIVTGLLAIVHCYNPLVHLLNRRIVLAQEINADLSAAQCVGRDLYVRTLSTFALRHDSRDEFFKRAGHCPVFSGYLIRRIKVLVTKKDWRIGSQNSMARVACSGLMVVIGGLLFAAGSVAQPPPKPDDSTSENGSPSARIARLDSQPKGESADPTAGMFRREPLDLADVPENERGLVNVRIGDLLKETKLGPVLDAANMMAAGALKLQFESPAQPTFNIRRVESFYGASHMSIKHFPDKEDHKNQLSFGVSDVCVRFDQPVSISDWVERFVPGATKSNLSGVDCFTLPVIPSIGPYPVGMANRGPRAMCITNGIAEDGTEQDNGKLAKAATYESKPNESSWAAAFARIDGGLLSFVSTAKEIDVPDEIQVDQSLSESEKLAHGAIMRLTKNLQSFALGADLSVDTSQIGVRVRINFAERSDAESAESDVRLLLKTAKQSLEKEQDQEEDDTATVFVKQMFERSTLDVVDNADGTFDVLFTGIADVPNLSSADFANLMAAELASE